MVRPARLALLAALFRVALAAPTGPGAPPQPPPAPSAAHVPGEILVRFRTPAAPLDRAGLRSAWSARVVRRFGTGAEHWRLGPGRTLEEALEALRSHPQIEYAEPNYLVSADAVPGDPRLGDLWALINDGQTGGAADADVDAELAWDVTTGSLSVVVAVIDSGIDVDHPDLAANLWSNPGEIAGNGFDDDGNGFTDDLTGWDFVQHDNSPQDDYGHGTHVAGTIGAVGDNGLGVVGLNWQVSLLPLRFLNGAGTGTIADAAAAIEYAVAAGADFINASWGGGPFSQTLFDAVSAAGAAGILLVASAGNGGSNTDLEPYYPSGFALPNVLSVAATDHADQLDPLSNFGPETVDLGAPGTAILSTLPDDAYGSSSGTSMAAAHVSGVAALIRAAAPAMAAAQIRSLLLDSVDPIASLAGIAVTGGRLNAAAALGFPTCSSDPQCDDGEFCNGEESCQGGVCIWGPPPCDDLDPCSADSCDETADSCANAPIPDAETAAGPDGVCDTADDNLSLFGADGICGSPADGTGDGFCDAIDNCPAVDNPAQIDTDGDRIGDACDPDPCLRQVALHSSVDFVEPGAWTDHPLLLPVVPAGAGSVEVIVEGDFNDAGEYAVAVAEGTSLGTVGDEAGRSICAVDGDIFPVSAANMLGLGADGRILVGVFNTLSVDTFCLTNRHSVTLRYYGELRLSIPAGIESPAGNRLVVPVNLSDVSGLGLTGVSATVRFNLSVLQAFDVRTGALAAGYALGSDFLVPGEVRFDLNGGIPLSGAGTLVEIDFDVIGGPGEGSPLEIGSILLNGGGLAGCPQAGRVNVTPCIDADGDGFGLQGDPSCAGGTVADCDDGDPASFPGNTEICDGVDNDCDGVIDNAAPPAGIPGLAVSEVLLSWDPLAESSGYDVVRGDLEALRSSGGDFAVATSNCLADDLAATQLAESTPPVPGQGFWFLLRGVNCGGTGSYDSGSSSQAGSRDPGVEASGTGCP